MLSALIIFIFIWLFSGALALFLAYNNKGGVYYGKLDVATIILGLFCGIGALICEIMASGAGVIVFKKETK